MIRHIVAMRFRDGAAPEVRAALMSDLAGLRDRIDGIADFRVRRNVSPEDPVVHGFRDLFWFDFRDAAARDAYLADPVHRAIGARLLAELDGGTDGIVVIDHDL